MVQSATVARLDRLPDLVARISSKKADLDDARADVGQLYKAAEDDGFNRRALKEAIRLRDMEPNKRNDYLGSLQAYCDKLGVWNQGDLFGEAEVPHAPSAGSSGNGADATAAGYTAELGRDAGRKGAAIESNPYTGDTAAYDVWHHGWLEGQAEMAQALGSNGRRRARKEAQPPGEA